jgi:hypothetical protein
MGLYNFFKFTLKKFLLTILFCIIGFFAFAYFLKCAASDGGNICLLIFGIASLFGTLLVYLGLLLIGNVLGLAVSIVLFVVWNYIVICFLAWIIRKIKGGHVEAVSKQ